MSLGFLKEVTNNIKHVDIDSLPADIKEFVKHITDLKNEHFCTPINFEKIQNLPEFFEIYKYDYRFQNHEAINFSLSDHQMSESLCKDIAEAIEHSYKCVSVLVAVHHERSKLQVDN